MNWTRCDSTLALVAAGAVLVAGLFAGPLSNGRGGKGPDTHPAGGKVSVKNLQAAMAKLRRLHSKLGKPRPGDWLARFNEPGQTFEQYRRCRPVLPTGGRRVIYIQPLGKFTKAQRKVVTLTADYLGRHFNLPVKINDDLPLSVIPAKARRTHPSWGDKQILSTYVLDTVLRPRLPKDAFGMIALTSSVLWPGKGWNFVFGQASLRQRVGVWSMYRYGDPNKGRNELRRVLLRTIKTASHELGHMMSMRHCTAFECSMCGSNSLGESDRRPLALCLECMAKICWATGTEPVERYRKLAAFCRTHGLRREAGRFGQFIRALGRVPTTTRAAN